MKRRFVVAFLISLFLIFAFAHLQQVQSAPSAQRATHQSTQSRPAASRRQQYTPKSKPALAKPAIAPPASAASDLQLKQFEQTVRGTQRLDGLFPLYRDRSNNKLYAEIKPEQLNSYFLCTMTLESGIGEQGIYSGLPLADFLFYFRRVNKTVQFVVANVYFRTQANDPLQRSVRRSFSDSVLASLPIKGYHPQRKTYLAELGPLLLEDFPGITPLLTLALGSPYTIDKDKSQFGLIKAFPLNVELESVYSFTSSEPNAEFPAYVTSLPDNRTFNLHVRYSWSQLPANTSYRSRKADDRVGYFITAFQNLSNNSPEGPFTRYINRWHLEKQDPTAPLSVPKKPIVFWIENTVPLEYRDAVRDGILMWNRAFEKAGFKDAIQVQQMPNKPAWDPADIRYNTIRWITSFDRGFLGMGPSRVNPLTGEILDADILIDSSFVYYLKQQYRSLAERSQMRWMPSLSKLVGSANLCSYGMMPRYLRQKVSEPGQSISVQATSHAIANADLCYGLEAARQFSMGALSLTMLQNASPKGTEMKQYVQEFLRMLIAHEVGHTLGLRHNFRASAMLSPTELNNPAITHRKGLVSSVMDYSAVNLAPPGTPQGDFFTHTIGPYDEWAIAYGYTPYPGKSPQAESEALDTIARRAPEPDLAYGTDEDAIAGLDPLMNAFDLSSDLLTHAPQQLSIARELWKQLDQRYPLPGKNFSDVRMIFDDILDYYFQYAIVLTKYIGGQSFNRYRAGDAGQRLPFEPIAAEQQQQALTLLANYLFKDEAFRFSPKFINKLAPSRWYHWGETTLVAPLDYPIYDRILFLQTTVLDELLEYDRLRRLRDAELNATPGQTLTLPELFDTLQATIWQEILQPNDDKLAISSLRRGLQREHLKRMTQMVLRKSPVPDDARTLVWYNLRQLKSTVDNTLKQKGRDMDRYTKAHLEETGDRISKTLDAELQTR